MLWYVSKTSKYGRKCDKIHLTYLCDDNEKCKEKNIVTKGIQQNVTILTFIKDVNLENIACICIQKVQNQN